MLLVAPALAHSCSRSILLDQGHRVCGHAFFSANETHGLIGGGFNANSIFSYTKQVSDHRPHGRHMGHDLGSFQDQGAVHIAHGPAALTDQAHHFLQEHFTISTFPACIGIGEVLPDITQSNRAEQGITQGMEQYISVRMAKGTYRMGDQHTTKPELAALYQAVYIEAEADPDHQLEASGFFLPFSNLKPSVKRKVFASGLRWVFAIK